MVNFKFELQRFAAMNDNLPTVGTKSFQTSLGTWVAVSSTQPAVGATILAYYDGKNYYTTASQALGTATTKEFSGTVSVATFSVTTAGTVDVTASAGILDLDGTNKVTTSTNGATVTFDSGVVTGTTETDASTGLVVTGTVSFAGVSSFVNDTKNTVELKNATVTVTDSGALTALTSGSVVTKSSFNGTTTSIVGTAITGAAEVSTTNGETYTITSNKASKIDLAASTYMFDVIGSDASEEFVQSTAGKGTTISAGAGNDTIKLKRITTSEVVSITGGSGKDTITAGADAVLLGDGSYIDGGEDADTITLYVNGAANDLTAKEITVDGGAGNDTINTGSLVTFSMILGGTGDDSIVNYAASNTVTGGDGADIFDLSDVTNYNANISDYDYATDKIKGAGASATTAANTWATSGNLSSDGNSGILGQTASAGGDATIQSTSGYFAVNLASSTTADQVGLAWVGDNAVTVDGSSESKKSLVITGRTNSEGDLLVGGAKADTLYAGASDSVYGGAGADDIRITSTTTYGVYVGVGTASGKDTVTNFANGFDSDKADTIYMVDGSVDDVSVSVGAANTTFTVGKGSLELTNVTANAVKILVNDAKVYAIKEGQYASVSDSDSEAAFYIGSGTGGGVDYSSYGDALMVDLSQNNFKNINSIVGGTGDTTLMGSVKADTLTAGAGGASLYGGAGKDVLVGNTSAKDEFFLTTGAGKDTVNSFTAGTDDTSDVLNFMGAGITGVSRASGTQFTVKISNSDSLTVNSASGKADEKIQWVSGSASGVAKIGSVSGANSFTYESDVTAYFGGSKKDTLTVSDSDDHSIWLDGSQGGATYASIDVVNAASATGNLVIAGDTASQSISGGRGVSSLWGGAGSAADTLSGNNSGTDMFWYGLGEGKDVMQNVGVEDTVNLYNINLANLKGAEIGNSSIAITTTAGETLTVNRTSGAATTTFQLADGSKWNANYSTKTWEQA